MSTNIFTGFEPQPNLPEEDLSETNAEILGLVLANQTELDLGHMTAEKLAWVYRVGHPAMQRALSSVNFDDPIFDAIDHGVKTYEALCTMVQRLPVPNYEDSLNINRNAALLSHYYSPDQVVEYVSEARRRFEARMPRTVQVVYEASERLLGPLADYAINGAALARQFDHNAAA